MARKRNKDDFFRYQHYKGPPCKTKRRPMCERWEGKDSSTHPIAVEYNITKHAVYRFIERVLKEDPEKYEYEKLVETAAKMRQALPADINISGKLPMFGTKAVISEGMVITILSPE